MSDLIREALQEAVDLLRLCDPKGERAAKIHAPEDESIRVLCERIGYGAVMDAAARLWRLKDPNGAHTTGPCALSVRSGLRLIRKALRDGRARDDSA